MSWWWAGLIAAGIVAVGVWPFRAWLIRNAMMDQPDQARKIHLTATPRGGGMVMALAILVIIGMMPLAWMGAPRQWWLALVVVAISTLGWLEDIKPRPVRLRLAIQASLALLIWAGLGSIDMVAIGPMTASGHLLWTSLGLIAVIWLMNLHNFMDGADGLAASQGLWAGVCFAVIYAGQGAHPWAWLAAGLAGACAGFLVWNRPVASVFMGDTGSLLVGGVIGVLAYHGVASGDVTLGACLMICSVFVVDATATLARRVLNGQRWYTPHATHAFQYLIGGGLSHAQLLALYMGLNLALVLPLMVAGQRWPRLEGWLLLGLYAALCMGWWQVQKNGKEPKE